MQFRIFRELNKKSLGKERNHFCQKDIRIERKLIFHSNFPPRLFLVKGGRTKKLAHFDEIHNKQFFNRNTTAFSSISCKDIHTHITQSWKTFFLKNVNKPRKSYVLWICGDFSKRKSEKNHILLNWKLDNKKRSWRLYNKKDVCDCLARTNKVKGVIQKWRHEKIMKFAWHHLWMTPMNEKRLKLC